MGLKCMDLGLSLDAWKINLLYWVLSRTHLSVSRKSSAGVCMIACRRKNSVKP